MMKEWPPSVTVDWAEWLDDRLMKQKSKRAAQMKQKPR